MNLLKKYNIIIVVIVFIVILFFGCESNFKEVQKINYLEFFLVIDVDIINIKYIDLGRIIGVLKSCKMLDYVSVDFFFIEFFKGIDVILYDKK